MKTGSIILSLFLVSSPVTAQAQLWETRNITVEGSSCVIVMQVDSADTGAVDVQGLTCPLEAGKSFAIRYVRLNAMQISFLLAKYTDKNIAPVLGASPTVALNPVFDRLTSIYERFGRRTGNENAVFPNIFFLGGTEQAASTAEAIPYSVFVEGLPFAVRTRFKLPTFERNIIWPDITLISDLESEKGWPDRYGYYYDDFTEDPEGGSFLRQLERGAKRKHADVADRMALCMTMHRFIPEQEFKNYWPLIDKLENALHEEEVKEWHFAYDPSYVEVAAESNASEEQSVIDEIAGNEAYDLHAHLTEEYWPPDYMILTGNLENGAVDDDGCVVADGGIRLEAETRSLHALVAVVTPIADEVVVKSAQLTEDGSSKLRAELQFSGQRELPFGDVVLKKVDGDSLIIPLRVELRYDEEMVPFIPASSTPTAIETILQNNPDAPVNFIHCEQTDADDNSNDNNVECTPFISKKMGEFPSHSGARVTPTYFSGPAYGLESLNINGDSIEVRDVPELSLVADAMSESGSCPFLYFEHFDGSKSYYGRVLIGATGLRNMKSETIPLPQGTRRILIREIEPEVTYLTGVSFDDAASTLATSSGMARLGPRDEIAIAVPSGSKKVTIAGYYELLN